MYKFLLVTWITLLFLTQVVFATPHYLETDEIKNMISGRAMTFFGNYGPVKFTGAAKWGSNGTIIGYTNYLGKKRKWKGTWYVKNNQYCRTLSGEGKTDFKCHRVQKINSHTILFIKPDGSVSSTTILH